MQTDFIVLADCANVSADQKLNVLGIFDTLHAASFPAAHPQMFLSFALKPGQKEQGRQIKGSIKLVNKRTSAAIVELTFEGLMPQSPLGQPGRLQQCIGLNGVVFPEPGQYEFQVFINGSLTAATPLYVNRIEIPTYAN